MAGHVMLALVLVIVSVLVMISVVGAIIIVLCARLWCRCGREARWTEAGDRDEAAGRRRVGVLG